jgi:hypothetical protein
LRAARQSTNVGWSIGAEGPTLACRGGWRNQRANGSAEQLGNVELIVVGLDGPVPQRHPLDAPHMRRRERGPTRRLPWTRGTKQQWRGTRREENACGLVNQQESERHPDLPAPAKRPHRDDDTESLERALVAAESDAVFSVKTRGKDLRFRVSSRRTATSLRVRLISGPLPRRCGPPNQPDQEATATPHDAVASSRSSLSIDTSLCHQGSGHDLDHF